MTSTPRGADAAVRDRLARQVPGLDLPDVPQRFLLVDYTDDSATGAPRPVGWGLQADGSAIVVHPDGRTSHFTAGGRAFDRLVDSCDHLLWLDQHPTD